MAHPALGPARSTPAARSTLALIVAGTIARIVLAATIGLGIDESYAAAVARPFSLSYYDHPPLVFWLAGTMEALSHGNHRVLLRLPFILLFAGTTWLIFRVTERSFGPRAGLYAALLLTLSPVMSVSSSGWVLPDGPLLFAIAATALCLSHIFFGPRQETRRWWLGAGGTVGLALLSKYHAAFLIAGALVFVATSPPARQWLRRPAPYVAMGIALMMALPVMIWNAQHGWASFRFQAGRAASASGNPAISLLQNLGGQAGYVLPWIWLPLIWVFIAGVRRGPAAAARWLFVCLSAGPIVFFTLVSLGGRPGLPHWPAPGFLLLFPLLGDALSRMEVRGCERAVRRYLVFSTASFVGLMAFVATQTATGWFSRAVPGLFQHGDPSLDAVDWTGARAALARYGVLDPNSVIVARNWIEAGKLGYALGPDQHVVCLDADARQFQFIAGTRHLTGHAAVLVTRVRTGNNDAEAPAGFAWAGTIPVYRAGYEVFRLAVYRETDARKSQNDSTSSITSSPASSAFPLGRSPVFARGPSRSR